VAEVLAELRRQEHKRAHDQQLYVTDSKGRLVDYVRLAILVVVPPQTSVLELLENQQIFLRATDNQETAVAASKKYGRDHAAGGGLETKCWSGGDGG